MPARKISHMGPALVLLVWPGIAAALCDVTYKVQPGDTLAGVADLHYERPGQAALIDRANRDLLRDGGLVAGSDIYIPCAAATAAPDRTPAPESAQAFATRGEMRLLTGGGDPPFADRAWPDQGLLVELVAAALELGPSPVAQALSWEPDRDRHLLALLDEKSHDMGFPWVKPDCAPAPETPRCARFHYSDPLMDLPIMLFKRYDSGLSYESDADLAGLRLCRTKGHFTHDLDRAGRRWLSDGVIELVRPETPEACFEALMAGEVDAVSMNVFSGAARIVAMGLRGRVVPLDKALSRETLHVVIAKTHPRGTTHLYRVNAGLAALHDSGRYGEIVGRHLEIFWNRLK